MFSSAWKSWGAFLSFLLSIYILVPTLAGFKEKKENLEAQGQPLPFYFKLFPDKSLNLGLDLRGGMYLEMEVDLAESRKNKVNVLIHDLERIFKKEKVENAQFSQDTKNNEILVEYPLSAKEKVLELIKQNTQESFEKTNSIPLNSTTETRELTKYTFRSEYREYIEAQTLKQAEEAIINRIDRYGVLDAGIQRQGNDRIVIELPGVKDPQRVIDVIKTTGQLEFRIVSKKIAPETIQAWVKEVRTQNKLPEKTDRETVSKINEALKEKLPTDTEVLFEVERDPLTKEITSSHPLLLEKNAQVTGEAVEDAHVSVHENEPLVALSFNHTGANSFGDLTKNHVNERLAIVLDGTIFSAPQINEPILDGRAQITLGLGDYKSLIKEAEDLALVLREGALPATLKIVNKTVIGPSLGSDSIRQGLLSVLFATLVVLLFMLAYYKTGGVIANIGLILNIILMFAILALFQAALTLPGIAGIVLTVGMAVDANIIIFERMREEKALGKSPRSIVESGYGNAMSAIIDANITTLISGIVLYQFGTGPIKGFATTLIIGIITTMFTAITVTRLIYDYLVIKVKVKNIHL